MADASLLNPADPADPADPASVAIADLRASGAHRLDPARFAFIEALARRAAAHGGEVRQLLDARLAAALAAYAAQHASAEARAGTLRDRLAGDFPAAAYPAAAAAGSRLYADGDFKGLHRLAAELDSTRRCAPLAGLLDHMHRQAQQPGGAGPANVVLAAVAIAGPAAPAAPPADLKALRYFRGTWSRLRVDQQLRQSLAKVPGNAGPLNSQLLVLRALQCLQGSAPAYLHRFMASVETLWWLDQASGVGLPAPVKATRPERDRRRKAGRSKPAL